MPAELLTKARIQDPDAPLMVRVEGMSKKYGDFSALEDVSFQIRKGEILGFLGPNGAGKTTAMRILSGYFPPSRGKVFIGEEDLFKNPQKVKRRIGYLPETVNLYRDMKVSEMIRFVARIRSIPVSRRKTETEDKLERCGLWNVRNRLIKHLSKGFKQRLGLAQALIGDPEVLLLDEPTSGLDPKQIIDIRTLIRELGKDRSIILSTHILPEVNMVCDRVLILNQGKVAASGTTDELEAGLQTRSEVFIVMGDRHRKDEALEWLRQMDGVERLHILEERGDRVHLSVAVTRGREIRPEISRLFVEHNIPLLEIRSGRLSLEEIFMKLVVKENMFT